MYFNNTLLITIRTDNSEADFIGFHTYNIFMLILNIYTFLNILLETYSKNKKFYYRIYLIKFFSNYLNYSTSILNDKIIIFIIRYYFYLQKKCLILWFYNPKYYFLHNFINWKYLIFDYHLNLNHSLKTHHFYDHVFHKKSIFLYHKNILFHYIKAENYVYKANIRRKIYLLEKIKD